MAIYIKQINLQKCGPIIKFGKSLSQLNLFYSPNEGGKSFLVEFLIKALFKNIKPWGELRDVGGGKISLQFGENELELKYPGRTKRLEDLLNLEEKALPSSLIKLMVVKEGETVINPGRAGIEMNTLKELLFPSQILDKIKENNIVKAAGEANIAPIIDIGKKYNLGKEYHEIKEKDNQLKSLYKKISEEYEQGLIKNLQLRENKLKLEKETQLQAKRFKAYSLANQIKLLNQKLDTLPENELNKLGELLKHYKELNIQYEIKKSEFEKMASELAELPTIEKSYNQLISAKRHLAYKISSKALELKSILNSIPDDDIKKIEQNIAAYKEKKVELSSLQTVLTEAIEKSKEYQWLQKSSQNYREFLNSQKLYKKPKRIWLLLATFTGLVGVIGAFIQPLLGAIMGILSLCLFVYYFIRNEKSLIAYKQEPELENIAKEFYLKFGVELTSYNQLDTLLEEQKKFYNLVDVYQQQINNLESGLRVLYTKIQDGFRRIAEKEIPEEKWEEILQRLITMRKNLEKSLQDLEKQLAILNVKEAEYEVQDPGIEFDSVKISEIENQLNRLKDLQVEAKRKDENLNQLKTELEFLKKDIEEYFEKLLGSKISAENWGANYEEMVSKRQQLLQELEAKKGELEGLGVVPADYSAQDPGVEFSPLKLKEIEEELEAIREQIESENKRLNNLKVEITNIIRKGDFSSTWNELLDFFGREQQQVEQNLIEKSAQIIAGKLIYETINEFQIAEQDKILEALNSREVKDYLFKLTQRYKSLNIEGNEIMISDEFNSFKLSDLSTGAREQVMLALRIGFLKRLLKQDHAFLILDDAFQHSDYKRRPLLVQTLCELALAGWQVLYFTMDDHIKSLFLDFGQKMIANNFQVIDL